MSDLQTVLDQTKNAPNLKALIHDAITELEAFLPVRDELENWKAQKAKLLAELDAIKAEVAKNQQAVVGHELGIADLRRQRARAEDELNVVHRDLARARADYEALALRLKRGL